MNVRLTFSQALGIALVLGSAALAQERPQEALRDNAQPQVSDTANEGYAELEAASAQIAKLFNAGEAAGLAGLFLSQGELIDDSGHTHRGQDEIESLLKRYFDTYPGAKLTVEVDSIRRAGSFAVEEGTRTLTTKDAGEAAVQYLTVWSQLEGEWKIASSRETSDRRPGPQDPLRSLAWLVGEWVNEGSDAVVTIQYRWSNDGNYLLGDFTITRAGEVAMKSEQRIAWDPVAGTVRSWTFDSDGGFTQGLWTPVEGGWVSMASAVLPDGTTGSATIAITPVEDDRYIITGTDRIVGDAPEEDFEVIVVRQAPAPSVK